MSRAKDSAAATVSGLVWSEVTSSTSRRTGTGLKKWMPTTCWGRPVTIASFMIGIDEVLVASTASGSSTIRSSSPKIATLAV